MMLTLVVILVGGLPVAATVNPFPALVDTTAMEAPKWCSSDHQYRVVPVQSRVASAVSM
jgi:hypothetical protein